MSGELLAVFAALAYGVAGVSIVQSKATARGDNGVFLSVVLTALLSCALWLGWGTVEIAALLTPSAGMGLAIFALAGVASNVIGRQSMYRATERIGAVRAGLLRRLTPLFSLPCAFLVLGEVPGLPTLAGGGLVLAGVLFYMRPSPGTVTAAPAAGLLLGILSPLAYALAYTLRGLGLDFAPDAALGTCIGALVGGAWVLGAAVLRRGLEGGLAFVTVDRRAGHWLTALALSAGQLLQFFALKAAPVVSVAMLGTLEVVFSALIILAVTRGETVAITRLVIAALLAMAGTALLFQG
ncbi:DMT family transporter [Aquicoccus sp. SU-CL01552]|uniref:DMT family transporter n=1 Tax=Aquicoccus sp. SU-CL01552 TaxID=3127656 RepID=UPI00333E428D